jgi:hypothetical protein
MLERLKCLGDEPSWEPHCIGLLTVPSQSVISWFQHTGPRERLRWHELQYQHHYIPITVRSIQERPQQYQNLIPGLELNDVSHFAAITFISCKGHENV